MFETIDNLESELFQCSECALRNNNNHGPTSYNKTHLSPLPIVGEGPGEAKDQFGVPLFGPSGKLLDKALMIVDITREKVATINIVGNSPTKIL